MECLLDNAPIKKNQKKIKLIEMFINVSIKELKVDKKN